MFGLEIIVIFVIIWWLVLFIVLPFGIERDENSIKGNDPGAPKNPNIGKKFIYTTVITSIIFVGIYYMVSIDFLNIRELLH